MFFGANVNITDSFNGLDAVSLGSTFWRSDVPSYVPGPIYFANVETGPGANLILDVSLKVYCINFFCIKIVNHGWLSVLC